MTKNRRDKNLKNEPMRPHGRSAATRETVKPFRLVKNFTTLSLAVIFVATLVLSMVLTQNARTVLMKNNEEYAILLADNLNHQVIQQFIMPSAFEHFFAQLADKQQFPGVSNLPRNFLSQLSDEQKLELMNRIFQNFRIELSDEEQFTRLDNVVRNTLYGYKVDVVNIYNDESQIIYSFDPDLVGRKVNAGREYHKALEGTSVSKLLQKGSAWGIWLGRPEQSTLMTYTPFLRRNPESKKIDRVMGAFEVGLDLSDDYRTIFNFLLMVVGVSASVMLMLFLVLRFYVGRGEEFLLQRAEERLKLEEQLSHAERLASLGEMAAGVSHEIRNPLGIIRSSAELLGKRVEGANRQLLDVVIEESTRLNDIITDFLSFARPSEPKFQDCDISKVLDKNLAFLAPSLNQDGYTVELEVAPGLPPTWADPNLLYQSFLNVLINAMQAMPQGGTIHVRAAADIDALVISFTDEGPGITEEALKKIWNPFFTTKEQGTGLGLCVVRNIIEAHGGNVVMENSANKGACVVVELPIGTHHGNHSDS